MPSNVVLRVEPSYEDLTVVLPTLNEAGNISGLIVELQRQLPGCAVIVVDDNSTDGTPDIVGRMAQDDPCLSLIARTQKACLTESIAAGIRAAQTAYVAWMDADFSHPPAVLKQLYLQAQESGCSVATRFARREDGSDKKKRVMAKQNDTLLASVLSGTLNFFIHRLLRLRITDYTSGFIVCRRDLLVSHKLVGDYGEYFIELVYFLERSGVEIGEVFYHSPSRKSGESKTGATISKLVRRGVKYLWLVLRMLLPKRVFGRVSLAVKSRRQN